MTLSWRGGTTRWFQKGNVLLNFTVEKFLAVKASGADRVDTWREEEEVLAKRVMEAILRL